MMNPARYGPEDTTSPLEWATAECGTGKSNNSGLVQLLVGWALRGAPCSRCRTRCQKTDDGVRFHDSHRDAFSAWFHLPNDGMIENRPGICDRELREFWRELARLITLFDEASPANILAGEIGKFSRKWCARRDSNAGPPA
jgi:hypothetical protein